MPPLPVSVAPAVRAAPIRRPERAPSTPRPMPTGAVAHRFETSLGEVALVTLGERLVTLQQPSTARAQQAFLDAAVASGVRLAPSAPSALARALEAEVRMLFAGEPVDFSGVALHTEGLPAFHVAVYEAARRIPLGRTRTYGELAAQVGSKGAARAVGQALARNPFGLVVPCHRVLAAGNRPGGFTCEGGLDTKRRILACEGVALGTSGGRTAAKGAPAQLALRIQNTMS